MTDAPFAGDRKVGGSLLAGPERWFKRAHVSKIPPWIETHHLTLLTILWSACIVGFSWLAQRHIHWLWCVSLMIALQYVTDLFDGEVGRRRNTGLVKWGFYMDHFLDYVFLCAILIGYSLILPDRLKYMQLFILAVFGAFMVNSFLSFAVTNKFKISYLGIGPTEIRLVFVVVNTLLICFGKTYMGHALPYVLAGSFLGLCYVVYRTGRHLWKVDMDAKRDAS